MERAGTIRVLIGKAGLDGHDRGAVVVALGLRDAGMEVIYTGRHQRPEQIVQAAIEEDVDVLGLSTLCDAHRTVCPKIVRLLREHGAGDMLFIVGGFVPDEDVESLKAAGVDDVFGPGTPLQQIITYIRAHVPRRGTGDSR